MVHGPNLKKVKRIGAFLLASGILWALPCSDTLGQTAATLEISVLSLTFVDRFQGRFWTPHCP